MSKEQLSGPLCKKRFKGIENFLKRVAFNLGNTPSQTEVKIISCIPIDVTDLQQKIIHLEKQLEDANAALQSSPSGNPERISRESKHSRSMKHSKPALNTNTTPVNLSKDNSDICQRPDKPVKPNNLEHYYAQPAKPYSMDQCFIQPVKPSDTDNYYTQHLKPYNMNHYCTASKICESKPYFQRQNFLKKKKKIFKNKKGTSPYVYYAQTYSSPFIHSNLPEEAPIHEENDTMTRTYLTDMISRQYKPEMLGDNISIQTDFSSPICRDVQSHCEPNCHIETDDVCSCCRGPFQNIDAHFNKHTNLQTYMVHQINTGSAFYNTDQYDLVPVKEKPVKIKKDLDRPRKKEVKPLIDMKCWPENVRAKNRYQSYPLPTSNNCTARPRADYANHKQRIQTREMTDKLNRYARKMPASFNRTEPIRILPKRRICRKERSINIETSQSCCIDFGNIYPKKICKLPQKQESSQLIPMPKKDAECLTTVINNNECQTEMSNMEVPSVDTKTEVTLNQIKSILQSVLAEVKVSSQTKGQMIQNKPKKDAVVQNGPSRNNLQTSSLMNSITYSPYAINPAPYVTSCSRQIRPNHFSFSPHGGMKCFHNFPVFIQTSTGRNMCSSCYRTSHFKPGVMKQATTIATNTEQVKAQRSRETDKLIKEIYKSMALTIDFPQKGTSVSDYYNEPKKPLQGFISPVILKTEPKKQPKVIRNVVQAVSELFMKKDIMETSDTFNSTIDSKSPSNEVSVLSHAVTSTDTELRTRKERLEKYMHAKTKQPAVTEVKKKSFREALVQDTNSVSESESSSSEAYTDTTLTQHKQTQDTSGQVEQKHKKGKSLLSKMLKSVKLFKSKEKPKSNPKSVEKTESEEETSSDSDDYQTVYSQKIEKNLRNRSRPHNLPKRKTHSKISYKHVYQRDRSPEKRKSPYMEQEYRRYWDEKLMFNNNNPRYSSERNYSEQSSSQKPPYYRTYEARTALVEPTADVPAVEPRTDRASTSRSQPRRKAPSKGMAWLKRHKMGIHCGPQWKKFVLEG